MHNAKIAPEPARIVAIAAPVTIARLVLLAGAGHGRCPTEELMACIGTPMERLATRRGEVQFITS
jgi:hypothetical protein